MRLKCGQYISDGQKEVRLQGSLILFLQIRWWCTQWNQNSVSILGDKKIFIHNDFQMDTMKLDFNMPNDIRVCCLFYFFFNYCKFGNFCENFIFVNSVKRHICHIQNSWLKHDLPASVNDRVIPPFLEDFIFMELCKNKILAKNSEFTGVHNYKIIFIFPNHNMCCGYSKEPSQWDSAFEWPKFMFKLIYNKMITNLSTKVC